MTNSQISSKWQPEKSALPTLSKYKSLANTIKRHLHFLPNDDSNNIHLKSLIVSSSGVKKAFGPTQAAENALQICQLADLNLESVKSQQQDNFWSISLSKSLQ